MTTPSPKPIARLSRISLREVWKHEAYDFTTWLQDNLDVLNEALGVNLSSAEREQSVGDFSADLLAEDEGGQPVIIENQLRATDHDHLGKVLVYLSNLDARAAIWICADPRPEHIKAVSWLNESDLADFYLCKLEAVRIGDSPPAPLLTKIVGPSAESRQVGDAKKKFTERHHLREAFWTGLLNYIPQKTKLHANLSPGKYSWLGTSAGHTGLGLNYVVRQNSCRAELYIDRGKNAGDENLQIFDALHAEKEAIEESYDGTLIWQRLDEKRACRIKTNDVPVGYRDEDDWADTYPTLVDRMIRLEAALRPHIRGLEL